MSNYTLIRTADVAESQITTSLIADANVTTAKLDSAAVTTAKLADANVTTAKLADSGVTTAKIADSNVTTAKLADANITTAKLADDAVTAAKLADVSGVAMSQDASGFLDVNYDNSTIGVDGSDRLYVKDSGINTSQLADSAVTTAKIADGDVTTAKLDDAAVTTAKINDDAVTPDKLDLSANYTFEGSSALTIASSGSISWATAPTSDSQLANKAYVDSIANGLSWKDAARVATTGDLDLSAPGASIDGVSLANGDRVLVWKQTNASQNGVYEFKGAAAAMVRASDMDTGSDFLSAALFVSAGSTWGDTGFVCTNDVAPAVGSDNIDFVQFTGAYQVVAGAGLTKTGNTLDVGAGDGIAADADAVRVRLAANKGLAFDSGEIAVQVDNTRAMYLSGSGFLRVGFDLAQAIYVNGSNLLAVRADSNYGMSIDATTGLRVDILSGGALEFEGGDLDVKDLGIDTARLASDAVTTTKIANEAVTLAKLAPDVQHKLGGYDSSFDYEIVSDNEVVSLPNGCEATVPDHLLFVNGRLMRIGASKDYTINGSNEIVFAGGFITGDTIQIIFNNMSA